MRGPEARALELAAYRDGELGPLRRWRVRRRLAREPAARRELERLELAAGLARRSEAERPAPDLWPGVRARLPEPAAAGALRAPRAGRLPLPIPLGLRGLGWAGAGLAAAALATALALLGPGGDAPATAAAPSVRWVDGEGHAVMVLQDDREATIIWVLEGGVPTAGTGGRRDVG